MRFAPLFLLAACAAPVVHASKETPAAPSGVIRFVNRTERELHVEIRAAGPVAGTGTFVLLPARTLIREVSAPYPPATFSILFHEQPHASVLVDEVDPANRRTRVTLGNLTGCALTLRVNDQLTELRAGRGHVRDVEPSGAVNATIVVLAAEPAPPEAGLRSLPPPTPAP